MRQIPEHRRRTLRRALAVMAASEVEGRSISARDVAAEIGMGESSGAPLRQDMIELGWLTIHRKGFAGRALLTDDGWAQLGGRPAKDPKVKDRPCIRCGKFFLSNGPGFRFCPRCQDTDAYRAGADTHHHVVF